MPEPSGAGRSSKSVNDYDLTTGKSEIRKKGPKKNGSELEK